MATVHIEYDGTAIKKTAALPGKPSVMNAAALIVKVVLAHNAAAGNTDLSRHLKALLQKVPD